jgi:mannose-6-phosphate isomerase-like protein (cupin superfamily)
VLNIRGRNPGGLPRSSPYFHRDQDENFYVLEGNFEFLVDDRTVECGPGSFLHLPKGTVHTFRNIGEVDGKLLVTISPAASRL